MAEDIKQWNKENRRGKTVSKKDKHNKETHSIDLFINAGKGKATSIKRYFSSESDKKDFLVKMLTLIENYEKVGKAYAKETTIEN